MAKEQQNKPAEKAQTPKPAVVTSGLELEGAPPPVSSGKVFELPRSMQRRQVRAMQRIAGNRFVQRKLVQNVIQRQGGGDTTPIPTLPDLESKRALALKVLKKAYGGLIKNETKVEGVEGLSALYTQYDNAMIRQGKMFKEDDELRDWKMGDAKNHPNMSKDFVGFNDPSSGKIFIDTEKKPDEQVATIGHELLHANASGEIISVLGRRVDEGMTESLMKKAFANSGYSAPGNFNPEEITFVERMNGYFGEGAMKLAYFGSLAGIRTLVDTAFEEEGKFDSYASAVRGEIWDAVNRFYTQFENAISGSELDKKLATVISYMEAWWFTDADQAHIENIWNSCSEEEKPHIRAAIESRLSSLTSHERRAQLRLMMTS